MRIDRLFKDYHPVEYAGDPDLQVNSIATHSSDVTPGSMFFALAGSRADGIRFIDDALRKGAVAVVSERKIDNDSINRVYVDDALTALSKWAACINGYPSRELNIYGVTGTNGKTTVSNLIYTLTGTRESAGLVGTSGYFYGNRKGKFEMTTPMSHQLHSLFREMTAAGVRSVSMEVSSHALALKRVDDISFASAVFTNLTQDHLDFHRTFENYFSVKRELFSLLKEKKKGAAVINIDDSYGRRLSGMLDFPHTTYGIDAPDADYRAEIATMDLNGSSIRLFAKGIEYEMDIGLIGRFNVYNCLAAVAWALEGGYSMETVNSVITKARPVAGRLEIVGNDRDAKKKIFIDYAHTPDALENVLLTLKSLTSGRLICVFGCGGDRDREKRPLMGKIAGFFADSVYITSDNPRSEDPRSIILDIEVGIRDTGTRYDVVPDREEAIKLAIKEAGDNDCVLIAGKGDEEFQIIGENMIPFSDREVAGRYI